MEHHFRADCGSSARRYAKALLILAVASPLIACGSASSDSPTGSTPPGTATLAWDPVTATNLSGYKVHYGTARGAYDQSVSVGNGTTYALNGLSSQTTYYMVVAAYDSQGNEGPYSNEVSKTFP